MYVINRRNEREAIRYDKITDRNIVLSEGLNVDASYLSKLVIESLKSGMTTTEIDELAAETAFYMSTYEPDYDVLATRISVSNLHKQTSSSFYETVKKMYYYIDEKSGKKSNVISNDFMKFVEDNKDELDSIVDYSRDFNYNYFGFKTLTRMYLNKLNGVIVERPQHMLMRVAVCIHLNDIKSIRESYTEMSLGKFTHASPTLFNAGSSKPQLASCFLLKCEDDLSHIYETNKRSALISKHGGGIGIDITNIRSKGSVIHSTNGKSDGLVPMCKVFNATCNYCNQCFHPNTIIYTKNGQKMIKDISIQDEVITIDGTYKPVVNIIVNKVNKEILNIRSTYSFEEVKVTKEHQIYCLRGQTKNTNFNIILNRLNRGIIKPGYISAEDLNTDDFIGFPLQQLPENDIYEKLGNDFFRFYGAMLGDGHVCSNRNEAGITLNKDTKIDVLMFIKNYLTSRNIHYWETNGEGCINVKWTNTNSGLSYDDLYDDNKEKRVHEKYINISRSHRIHLLKGLLETDGSNLKEIYFCSTSYKLSHNVRYLLLSLGILSSGNIRDDRGKTREIRPNQFITNKKISYRIRISKHPVINEILDVNFPGQFCKYFIHNNIIWSRIKRITTEQYEGQVYDLSILNNNNYVVGSLGLVHNSGKRKGSIAMYLQPWHPDIFDFLALRYNNPPEELRARDLFTAMWIPDIFMRRVERDEMWSLFDPNVVRELCDTYGEEFDKIYEIAEKEKKYVKRVKARDVFKEIIHSQQETGLPYISYKDNINRKSNQKNIGLIRSSNLCVSGDTKILTTEGHIEIKNLVDKEVSVWNGLEWSKTTVRKTGENQELVSVTLSNGETIKCTPYHKFPIVEGYQHTKYNFAKQKFTMIEAKNLVKNMKLAKYLLPNNINVSSNYDLKYPYTEGMFTGDGTYENKEKTTAKITLYHDKIKLYDLLDKRRETTNQSNPLKKDVYLPLDISPKYTVPHDKSSVFCKVAWLAGLVDSDGVLTNNAGSYSIQICSIDKQFLLKIRLMLQTIGVDTKVTRMSKAGKRLMPDGKGGKDYYDCKESFRLLIPFQELNDLIRLGFETHRIDLSDIGIPNRSSSHFIKIENVTSIEGKYDTYCFTEPKRNMGMFNGVMLGNCNEINEFTDTNSVAVCNLASLSLPSFVKEKEDGSKYYDFMELGRITKIAIRNLNKVIDRTYYPVKEAETNNLSYRPIGLGIQGLADVFAMFRTTWENSSLSKALNQLILEVVYYYALETSHEIAMENGSYDAFEGSPISEGILQCDMWDVNPMTLKGQKIFGEVLKLDWEGLKEKCKKGVRNSLLIALMPTATSSQILGNNEAFEPFTSNIYTRSTISGDFIMVNKHLAKHLKELNLWSKDMVNKIIENNGSIQGIKEIPVNVREIYKTVWEISQKIIIDFAADRGAFVDQSQSMNIFMEQPSYAKLSSMHLYGWKKGLKTGSYYIRSKPSRNAVKFTILTEGKESDTEGKESEVEEKKEGKKYILNGKEMICNDDVCTMCSS